MKNNCEGCGTSLPPDCDAYICSHECTFCPLCFSRHPNCPHCGGELVRRPRRCAVATDLNDDTPDLPVRSTRPWLIWAISFGVWLFVSLAATVMVWQVYRSTKMSMSFLTTLWLELGQVLTFAPLTPPVFAMAVRYPIRRDNWQRRLPLYLGAGILFSFLHVAMRSLSPYAVWDSERGQWVSGVWDSHIHAFRIQWHKLQGIFLDNIVDDITGTFVPIVLVAHLVSYYRKLQEREIRATQLEGQLAKAHLQALKSQLQPHFLFNTMHSISALMMTDVRAADRMITLLGDLLRMNLEAAGIQITTLSRELDFVNCYLSIEKVRFEEKLKVTFDIAPETLDAQVPLLLLQPLVDNAVKHGISRLTEGGEIRVSASVQNAELQIQVADNGPAFGQSEIKSTTGLGLKVTQERLETLYGANQSLELMTPPEGGVIVVVSIPFRSSGEQIETSKSEALQAAG